MNRAKALKAIRWFLTESDIQGLEVVLATGALYWAIITAFPGNLFATNQAFTTISLIFSEPSLFICSVIAGFTPIVGVTLEIFPIRRVALLILTWYYSTLGFGIWYSYHLAPSLGIYIVLSLAAAWGYWRLGQSSLIGSS